jgi:hypothetical protein
LPVGDSDGDAILLKYGDQTGYRLNLVDGGYAQNGDAVIERHYGRDVTIHNMVVSHADNDHAAGVHPGPGLYANQVIHQFHGNWTMQGWIADVQSSHEYLVELEALARSRGMEPNPGFQGSQVGPFHILAPTSQRYVNLIPHLDKTPPPYRSDLQPRSFAAQALGLLDRVGQAMNVETLDPNPPATSHSNETSVVQLGTYDGHTVLLTADVGLEGLFEATQCACNNGILTAPDLVQIPHQGSRRNVTPHTLNAWLGQPNGGATQRGVAMVMVGAKKDEHPRNKAKNAFIRAVAIPCMSAAPGGFGRTGAMRTAARASRPNRSPTMSRTNDTTGRILARYA